MMQAYLAEEKHRMAASQPHIIHIIYILIYSYI